MKKNTLIIIVTIVLLVGLVIFLLLPKDKGSKELKVSFYDNGSMGYYWDYKVDKEGIVEITSDTDYSGCDMDAAGCGGRIIYTVKPLKEGKVKVSFEWIYHTGEIAYDAIYDIEVTKDLEIKETHSGSYFESNYYKK